MSGREDMERKKEDIKVKQQLPFRMNRRPCTEDLSHRKRGTSRAYHKKVKKEMVPFYKDNKLADTLSKLETGDTDPAGIV